MRTLDIERILATNISDIHPAYGGVRGKTMSSRGQGYAWPVIKEAGVDTIIDLRNDGVNQCMMALCEEYGMEYCLMTADAVIVFDERHRDAITRVLDYSHWGRIVLFNKIALDENGNVEDPHYQTAAVYRRVAKHIENGCKRLVEQWKLQPPKPED